MNRSHRRSLMLSVLALLVVVSALLFPSLHLRALDELAPIPYVQLDSQSATPTPFLSPVSLGDFVWDDLNRDGVQDAGEPGLSGITVQLWDEAKTSLLDETETDASGQYSLLAPMPGSYRVRIVLPTAIDMFAPQYSGDPALDSDIGSSGPDLGFSDAIGLNDTAHTDLDAGILRSCAPTPTPSPTPSPTPTATGTLSGTATPSLTPSPTRTPTATPDCPPIESDLTLTWTPTATATLVSFGTATRTPTASATALLLDTATPAPTLTASTTDEPPLPPPNVTDTPTATPSLTPSPTPNPTETPFPPGYESPTPTPTPTRTPTPINLGNLVWDDLDGDGEQDAGEPGLSGVTVQLWNSAKTLMISQTVTNGSGIYSLVAPLPGSYRIRVVLPGASDAFSPKDQAGGDDQLDSDINLSGANFGFTDIISIASNVISMTTIDAGLDIYRTPTPTRTPTPINLGNLVWDDLDGDGRQDAGEPGVPDVTVQLWNSAKTLLIASTTTNGSGLYTVVAPLPGDYRIRMIPPAASDAFSPKDQAGGDDLLDSDINPDGINAGFTDVITIASNVISMTSLDAGLDIFRTPTPTRTPTPINLGNLVWNDLDEDGVQDMDEPGLAGIEVQLWNATKSMLLDETTTNASGIYTLVAPLSGNYRIRVVLPGGGYQFSLKDQGSDTADSDINPAGINAGFTDVIDIASNVISISSLDAGVIVTPPLPMPIAPDLGILTATPTPTALVAPRPTPAPATQSAPEAQPDCTGLRLTAPLDGLPNGGTTFYWDPLNLPNVTYAITVFDEGGNALVTFSAGSATNISGDVSQAAIGGAFQLIVRVTAFVDGQSVCSDQRYLLRAAPEGGSRDDSSDDDNEPRPTATPTQRGTVGGNPTG